MVAIKVNIDTAKARKQIKGIRDQVPFATRLTLNQLARNTKADIDEQMKAKLDRPTRFTLRAIRTDNAKSKTMTSVVRVNDKQRATGKPEAKVLEHLFSGGGRSGKAAEGKLRGLGVLPAGKFIVPGNAAPLDSFGNIKRSFIRQLINYFSTFKPERESRAGLEPGVWMRKFDRQQKKKRKKAGKSGNFEFFVVHKKVDGVTQRRRSKRQRPPEPIILFVDNPRYRQFFDMKKTAEKVIIRDLDKEFEKNYERAIATAKPIN